MKVNSSNPACKLFIKPTIRFDCLLVQEYSKNDVVTFKLRKLPGQQDSLVSEKTAYIVDTGTLEELLLQITALREIAVG